MTIDRPDKLNALNADVMASLKAVCAWMEESDDVRVLVVRCTPNPPPEGKRAKPHASWRVPTSPNLPVQEARSFVNGSETTPSKRCGT